MTLANFQQSVLSRFVSVLVIVNLLGFTLCADYALAESVKVPSGTSVTIQLNETVSPEVKKTGDPVSMSVVNDVRVGERVVIEAGAKVNGEVLASETRNFAGIPAKIAIAVRSVEAVDGTQIMLSATSKRAEGKSKMLPSIALTILCCLLFLLWKGEDASIAVGTQIVASTAQRVTVTVELGSV